MSPASIRIVLRSVAMAIAIAGAIDPAWTIDRSRSAPVVLVNLTSGTIDHVRQALGLAIGEAAIERSPEGHRVPCLPQQGCVIVADGTLDADVPADIDAPLLAIAGGAAAPNVRMLSATIASPHLAAASTARIVLEGRQMNGQRTTVRVRDGNATLGSVAHEWSADGPVTLDVPWWPIAGGPRVLRVDAESDGDEETTRDNAVDVTARVAIAPLPVLVFDARPSWTSTFVRRALEDDARFVVEHRARVAPAIAAATRDGRLDVRALDLASVLIIGGPDALTDAETSLIDRFTRTRGGTAILLPEREPRGASTRLFQGVWREQLTAEAQAFGPLRATEILGADSLPLGSTVLARQGDRAVVAHIPAGAGAVVVSGAMDAWRYREGDASAPLAAGTFDRFWTSIAAEAAVASRSLSITFEHALAAPGTRQRFRAVLRSMAPVEQIEASAIARCGAEASAPARPVRLWPAGSSAAFTGEVPIGADESCELEIAVGESRVITGIAAAPATAASGTATLAALERAVVRAGGTITRADNLTDADLPAAAPEREQVPRHPMRSAWWILPFALCLSGEWWLRRRDGAR